MDPSKAEVVSEFISLTGVSSDQAQFYLESANWDIDAAASSFFEHEGDKEAAPTSSEQAEINTGQQVEADTDDDETDIRAVESLRPRQNVVPTAGRVGGALHGGSGTATRGRREQGGNSRSAGGAGKIRTLSDLKSGGGGGRGGRDGDDDEDDDEEPNEYYTGGGKSGMMVQDPKKPKPRGGNSSPYDVDAIFDRARELGARVGSTDDLAPNDSPASGRRGGAFRGVGRTLGGPSDGGNEEAEDTPADSNPAPTPQASPPAPIKHTITFWLNGFTVDDGPLRDLHDPANFSFINSINNGECPKELSTPPTQRHSTPIEVSMSRQAVDYVPPVEPSYVAFRGTANRLTAESADGAGRAPRQVPTRQPEEHRELFVDDSEPTTSIQIRLADGTRMVSKFNHTHTVADIRDFILTSRPGPHREFRLQAMGFPPRILEDMSATLEAAGLLNAVVLQKPTTNGVVVKF